MRCCEAWDPLGKCFDPTSFEWRSQIIASLTRENLAEREAEIGNLSWTQTEKDNALAPLNILVPTTRGSSMCWRKQSCLSSSAVSTTRFEFARMTQGHSLMVRAFDPIFRWLQDAIIPTGLDFLQPAQCAYADDLAVAALSFRDLMAALALAFHSVDYTAGLNLNHRKCCWVQYGSESRESLLNWLAGNCEEFRVTQIVRFAKYVGTATFTVGRHPGKIHPARTDNQRLYQKPGRATMRPKDLCGVCVKLHWVHM